MPPSAPFDDCHPSPRALVHASYCPVHASHLAGLVTWEDALPMMQYFDQLDLDGSGSLTLDEMHFHSELMRSSSEVSDSQKLLQNIMWLTCR